MKGGTPLIRKSRETDQVLVTPHVGGYVLKVRQTRSFMIQRVNQVINNEFGLTL